jgi:hypothetical protein
MAANLAMFLNDPKTTLAWGATAGFLAGFGWVTMGIAIVSLFERRPWGRTGGDGGDSGRVALDKLERVVGGAGFEPATFWV